MNSIIELIQESWNATPAKVLSKNMTLGRRELKELLSKYEFMKVRGPQNTQSRFRKIRPLYSHHTFGDSTLFGIHQRGHIAPRILKQLLIYDGIVAANPIEDIKLLVESGRENQAIQLLNSVVHDLAVVQPLIENDLLSFTSLRPRLVDQGRSEFFKVFNIDTDMSVFTGLVDWAAALDTHPGGFEKIFRPAVAKLVRVCGLSEEIPMNLDGCVALVQSIAADMLEVSWQLSVASKEPECDLAIQSGRPERLLQLFATETGEGWIEKSSKETQHFMHMEIGPIPNLDADSLSVNDAVSIRKRDVFEVFRITLSQALSSHAKNATHGACINRDAVLEFEQTMEMAGRALEARMKNSRLSDHLGPAGAGATIGFAHGMGADPEIANALWDAAAGGASTLFPNWLNARSTSNPDEVALRYYTMLSGSKHQDRQGYYDRSASA